MSGWRSPLSGTNGAVLPHHEVAAQWIEQSGPDQVAFCRVTQMGLLRLLTNSQVMGREVQDQGGAWSIYERILTDPRVRFLPEPNGLERIWKSLTKGSRGWPNLWTDAYLLAFAQGADLELTTFDKGLGRLAGARACLLPGA
ncbi:MAG: VapC toxin family PIN domain ribonuclease [Acidobacteria bacterium]|nr:VapC toxin family PIN domain ribonuclease [Acidobacteriota bacterium]